MVENADGKVAMHLLGVAMGTVAIIFYRIMGSQAAKFQKQYFGKTYSVKGFQLVYLFGGIAIVVINSLAILSLLNII